MDPKVLYALTAKIFNTLKKLGIKPKIGVTTDIERLPGTKNSLNTDLSKLGEGNPESLKKLIANDANFLPQANADEIIQFNNNLEYLKATYPDTFSKPQVVTESKTGIKTLIDDVNKQLQGKRSMEIVNPKTGEVTVPEKPIRRAEEPTGTTVMGTEPETMSDKKYFYDKNEEYDKIVTKHKRAAAAHDQLDLIDVYDKIAPDQLGEVIAEMAGKNVDRLTDAQRRKYYTEAQDYLTDFIKIDRIRRAVEKANKGLELTATDRRYLKFVEPETKPLYKQGDPITSENFGDTPFAPDQETLNNLKIAREQSEKLSEAEMIKQKYGNVIDDNLLQQILIDDNPQRKAEVLATIDEALTMGKKGMSEQQIIDIIKNTTRTKQAKGGLIKGLSYKSMFNDLDRTLNKGLGTMFKKKK